MKKPNFFIIGAPRCGTTSLWKYLLEHPKIFMPKEVKEVQFFSSNLKSRSSVKSLEEYEGIFRDAGTRHKVIGEASTHYLYSNTAIETIESRYDNVKYIVMIRDPVEMAKSLHKRRVFRLQEDIKSFEKAWSMSHYRREGKYVPNTCLEPKLSDYKRVCKVGTQISKLLDHVSNDRVGVFTLDKMKNDPLNLYKEVLRFLSVPYDGRDKFEIHNPSRRNKYPAVTKTLSSFTDLWLYMKKRLGLTHSFKIGIASQVRNLCATERIKYDISDEFEDEMRRYYERDVSHLESILGRDLSEWKP